MAESTECLMFCDVLSDAIELKGTRERNAVQWEADRRKLWDVKNQQRDYQDFIREVLINAGIKDPNQSGSESETESERAIGIAHEDHLNGQNVEPNYARYTSPVYGENEVYGSHKGQNKNVILTDDDATDYEAPLSLHMEHGNSYGLQDEPKSSRRVLLSENGNTSDDVDGSVRPQQLIWSSSRDVPRQDSVRIGQEKCSRKRNVVKGHDEEKRRIMIQNRTGDLNLRRSSRLDATSGDQSRNFGLENAVQNVGKLGKPVKGRVWTWRRVNLLGG